jgi:predicted nucleic acid-binding protein
MSVPHLLDSCIVSQYLAHDAAKKSPGLVQRIDEVITADGARISIVTVYEINRGLRKLELRGGGQTKRRLFAMFMSTTTIYGLDAHAGRAWDIAADLHARAAVRIPTITFEEADLLIFATALANQMRLLTSDQRLVERLTELGLGEHVEGLAVS